jgi:hypoxanthine phosphoribosyltransferase
VISAQEARRLLETAELEYSATDVSAAVARLASRISAALADTFPLVLCVMRGSVVFTGQLLPQLKFPLELGYIDLTRYGAETRGGEITWKVAPGPEVAGRVVLVLDDILDEGHTLVAIRDKLLSLNAERIVIAVLCERSAGRRKAIRADFSGLALANRYVFGFGMDVRGAWRNLPEIYGLKEDLK